MAAIELYSTPLFSDANLVSYYRLENVSDSKGANTLTNTGTTPFNAAKFNNGADLGASNSTKYLYVNSNLGVSGNGDATLSCWIKLQTEIGSGTYKCLSHSSNGGADRYIDINYNYNAGTRQLSIDSSGGTAATQAVTLGTSVFNHIAITRNISGNVIQIYLNGVAVGVTGTNGTASGGNTNKFYIGANTSAGNLVSGIFDDLAIFNRVLTPTEISNLYNGTWNSGGFFAFM